MQTREITADWQVPTGKRRFKSRVTAFMCYTVATCARCWCGLYGQVTVLACRSRAREHSHNFWICIMGKIGREGAIYYFTWRDFDLMISQALGDASGLGIQECQ